MVPVFRDIQIGGQPVDQRLRGAVAHHALQRRGQQVDRPGRGDRFDVQRKALQRLAVGGDDAADRTQRRAEAAVGKGLVKLGHLDRRQAERAEQRRGEGRRLFLDAEQRQLAEDALDAERYAETRGRDVIGLGQRGAQLHLAVELAVVVVRFPVRGTRLPPQQRAVVQRGDQSVVLRILERGQI